MNVTYSAHVEDIGWQDYVESGRVAGITGKNKKVEAQHNILLPFHIKNYIDFIKSITYSLHHTALSGLNSSLCKSVLESILTAKKGILKALQT